MFDTEKLIQEIQVRDHLWNVNSNSYMDKSARRSAWEEIGAVFNHDWHTFTKKQKDEKVNYLIKKWTNVRDYYMREKKRARNSPKSGVRKKKKYYFYDSLTFLDTITPKKRKRSFSDSQEMESNNTVEYLEDTSNDVSYDQCIVVEEGSLSESSRYIKQEDETMTSMPSFETHVLSPIDKSQVDINVTANQNFLLSLLPDFTSLDERQNMKFRLGVLNLLSDIKFGK